MSFLSLAYLAGALAVALPILAHLIRQAPKDEQTFSSLMFLKPSTPKFTRRSRIDQWLLLLLRAAALVFIALAFSRPFLRDSELLKLDQVRGRQVAVLVDVSASMRRAGVMEAAKAKAAELVQSLEPADAVGLYVFDDALRPLVGFDTETTVIESDAGRIEAVTDSLVGLEPTWRETRLGASLAALAQNLAADSDSQSRAVQVELISDFAGDPQLDELTSVEWPEEVRIRPHMIETSASTDAIINIVETDDPDDREATLVRVTSSDSSRVSAFSLQWFNAGEAFGESVTAIVPAGESRVFEVPLPPIGADRLELMGDEDPFGNVVYVVPREPQTIRIDYVGPEASTDADGKLFYLARSFVDSPTRRVELISSAEEKDTAGIDEAVLTVVGGALNASQVDELVARVEGGHTVLCVVETPEQATKLGSLIGTSEQAERDDSATPKRGDLRLGSIEFSDSLFRPFASPQFNDFTDLRFWQTTALYLPPDESRRVLARFDDGTPFLWRRDLKEGTVFAMTAGWQPEASQLALSNRFVPLMEQILVEALPRNFSGSRFVVGDTIPVDSISAMAKSASSDSLTVLTPSQEMVSPSIASDVFADTNEPGVYLLQSDGTNTPFAVNVALAEQTPARVSADELEQAGAAVGVHASQVEEFDRQRGLRDRELEDRQKLWKTCLIIALGLLIVEMLLAGWLRRRAVSGSSVSEPSLAGS